LKIKTVFQSRSLILFIILSYTSNNDGNKVFHVGLDFQTTCLWFEFVQFLALSIACCWMTP